MTLPLRIASAAAALAALTGCLYTGEVPTVLPQEEPENPVILNEQPPRYARVAVGPDGQLFEVWVTDANDADRDALTISWTLENLTGLRGEGSKLFLRSQDLPEPDEGRASLVLQVQVRDPTGLENLEPITWQLTAQPYLGVR